MDLSLMSALFALFYGRLFFNTPTKTKKSILDNGLAHYTSKKISGAY